MDNTGETNLIGAEGATTRKLSGKRTVHNNSGKKALPHRRSKSLRYPDRGVGKSYYAE